MYPDHEFDPITPEEEAQRAQEQPRLALALAKLKALVSERRFAAARDARQLRVARAVVPKADQRALLVRQAGKRLVQREQRVQHAAVRRLYVALAEQRAVKFFVAEETGVSVSQISSAQLVVVCAVEPLLPFMPHKITSVY